MQEVRVADDDDVPPTDQHDVITSPYSRFEIKGWVNRNKFGASRFMEGKTVPSLDAYFSPNADQFVISDANGSWSLFNVGSGKEFEATPIEQVCCCWGSF